MSREEALTNGRAAAEEGMRDACVITRTTATSTDETTGVQHKVTTTVYSGQCRVQQHVPGGARPTRAGERYQAQLPLELQLPIAAVGIKTRDDVLITASLDPDLAGRRFKVRELAHKSEATSRRIGVEEAT